jgi:hydroxymethylpyrimidine kinase/phosphomethylpyrimidine kinase
MRPPAPHDPPVALTVAGSDSGGGAGVQADLKTMAAHGVFGTSALTAVTAQNTRGVESTHVLPVEEVRAQLDAVADDFDLAAVKTGMLAAAPVVEAVTEFATDLDAPLVVDPVMVAASGDRLLAPEAESAYVDLFEHAALVTPNADEAGVLTDVTVESEADAERAGAALVEMGADAALVKGGHWGGERVVDVLVVGDGADGGPAVERFVHDRVDTDATHGSGCALSSAVAANLAGGAPLSDAVADAVAFMTRAVRYHSDVGEGPGAVHHLVETRRRAGAESTVAAVRDVRDALVDADVGPLVPAGGTAVVGAAPFADAPDEVAVVDGRIRQTADGAAAPGEVRFGGEDRLARFLVAAREGAPDRRFACNLAATDAVRAGVEELGWTTAELDRTATPDGAAFPAWAGETSFGGDGGPVAVLDGGAVGEEAMVRVVAGSAEELEARVLALSAAVQR